MMPVVRKRFSSDFQDDGIECSLCCHFEVTISGIFPLDRLNFIHLFIKRRIIRNGTVTIDAIFFKSDKVGTDIPLFKNEDFYTKLRGCKSCFSVIKTAVAKEENAVYPVLFQKRTNEIMPLGWFACERITVFGVSKQAISGVETDCIDGTAVLSEKVSKSSKKSAHGPL